MYAIVNILIYLQAVEWHWLLCQHLKTHFSYLLMFKKCKLPLFLVIVLFLTNEWVLSSPPNLWPNTFSPAIGFNKKGLTLGNKKDGFTNMTPVFYSPKQPEIKVNAWMYYDKKKEQTYSRFFSSELSFSFIRRALDKNDGSLS